MPVSCLTLRRRPDDRSRILVVVGNLDVGGVEMDIVRNIPCIDRARFDIRVYAFMGIGKLDSQLSQQGIELVLSPSARRAGAPGPVGSVRDTAAERSRDGW